MTYVDLPYWPFDVEEGLLKRIRDVTSWFLQVYPQKPEFRVKLSPEQWHDLTYKNDTKQLFTYYVSQDVELQPHAPPDGGTYENWIQLANVLFCVEMK